MNLTKLFALFMASIAAAAPSAEYSQISVKIIDTAAQNHGSVVHSSQELVTNGESPLLDVSFPFTLSASYFGPHGEPPSPSSPKLPFGFFDSGIFPKGVLGAVTLFNFQQGKLRVGDRLALGQYPSQSYYPFTSLVPLSSEYTTFDLVVRLETLEGNRRFFLDFANKGELELLRPLSYSS